MGPRTKVHEITGIRFEWPDPNTVKFRRAPTKSVRDIRCGKILLPGKIGQSLPQVTRFVTDQYAVHELL